MDNPIPVSTWAAQIGISQQEDTKLRGLEDEGWIWEELWGREDGDYDQNIVYMYKVLQK